MFREIGGRERQNPNRLRWYRNASRQPLLQRVDRIAEHPRVVVVRLQYQVYVVPGHPVEDHVQYRGVDVGQLRDAVIIGIVEMQGLHLAAGEHECAERR